MKVIKTRKAHDCSGCGLGIPKGTKVLIYRDVDETAGGWAPRRYLHVDCAREELHDLLGQLSRYK